MSEEVICKNQQTEKKVLEMQRAFSNPASPSARMGEDAKNFAWAVREWHQPGAPAELSLTLRVVPLLSSATTGEVGES